MPLDGDKLEEEFFCQVWEQSPSEESSESSERDSSTYPELMRSFSAYEALLQRFLSF